MATPVVAVVGETPSLGRSIVDLLEADGVRTQLVPDLVSLAPSPRQYPPVIVVASNGPFCVAARHWLAEGRSRSSLVVVGTRDPIVGSSTEVYHLSLPLVPEQLLALVRALLSPHALAPLRTVGEVSRIGAGTGAPAGGRVSLPQSPSGQPYRTAS